MIAGERMVEAWFFWIGVVLMTGLAAGALLVVYSWMWEQFVGATRLTVWWRRFVRNWKEFDEWHKRTKGYDASERDPYKD